MGREDDIQPFIAKFRKRRKHVGAKWKPQKDQVLVTQGPYCPSCRQRHGYGDKKNLATQYVKHHTGRWQILWVCTRSHTVIDHKIL